MALEMAERKLGFPNVRIAVAHLFNANNLHYIVQVINESPELEEMIAGEEYMNKLSENYLRQVISNYQSSTCESMLYCFRDEEEGYRFFSSCFCSRGNYLRRRLSSFNAMFEEISSSHARWVLQQLELCKELFLSIVEKELTHPFLNDLRSGQREESTLTSSTRMRIFTL
ncbi:hypothetical protein LguiB_027947 [Lonicera macranthoides]